MRSLEGGGRSEVHAVARHYYDFLRRLLPEAGEFAWQAGVAVVQSSLDGNVCLPMFSSATAVAPSLAKFYAEFCPDLSMPPVDQWQEKLRVSGLFVPLGGWAPFVIDGAHSRLYLQRYWQYEQRLAEQLNQRANGVANFASAKLKIAMNATFGPVQSDEIDCQRLAAGLSACKRLTVISGGPGTGKTYTVARIMALLWLLAAPEKMKIGLAAPTGKAASRLQESIKKACENLSLSSELMAAINAVKAGTIHRLLGWRPNNTEFRYNRDQQLALDLLIVDEASMVDLPLMTKLFEAMPPQGRVILLGDKNQLASVESGRVLADICGAAPANNFSGELVAQLRASGVGPVEAIEPTGGNSALADCVVMLTRSYRFHSGSAIGSLAGAVLAGDVQLSKSAFSSAGEVRRYPFICNESRGIDPKFIALVQESYHELVISREPEEAFRALERFQVLCVHRGGLGGVRHMNRQIESILVQAGMIDGGLWYCSRPVIISGNHYNLQLFNGDVGVCLEDNGELRVFFPKVEGGCQSISPARMPRHETAYAITVHKSQGSEFEHVVMTLPENISPLVCRELLYTAVTRAKKSFTLWGMEDIWQTGLNVVNQRQTGLVDLLY